MSASSTTAAPSLCGGLIWSDFTGGAICVLLPDPLLHPPAPAAVGDIPEVVGALAEHWYKKIEITDNCTAIHKRRLRVIQGLWGLQRLFFIMPLFSADRRPSFFLRLGQPRRSGRGVSKNGENDLLARAMPRSF
ncbi:MAG: hypothetical protein HUU16_21485 [Candidatus Omnitrophica bacterium]|nr:hypothetical protein [Candidatus Omnitrophota bacterium]